MVTVISIARHVLMMIEVEIKAAAVLEAVERKLRAEGAIFEKSVRQVDAYFNAPHRDFQVTDEAMRLRQQGDRVFMTYKGKKLDAQSKARKEVEVEVSDFSRAEDILLSLGFTKTLQVSKTRLIYHYREAEICLDDVDGLGQFVEAEAQIATVAGLEKKRDELIELLRDLGVRGDLIRESYLEMILAKLHQLS